MSKTLAIFSSSKLNDQNIFTLHEEELRNKLTSLAQDYEKILIGNIKNGLLISLLKEMKIELEVKKQYPTSLRNSNKSMINNSNHVLFFHYKESESIKYFIEYAQEHKSDDEIHIHKIKGE